MQNCSFFVLCSPQPVLSIHFRFRNGQYIAWLRGKPARLLVFVFVLFFHFYFTPSAYRVHSVAFWFALPSITYSRHSFVLCGSHLFWTSFQFFVFALLVSVLDPAAPALLARCLTLSASLDAHFWPFTATECSTGLLTVFPYSFRVVFLSQTLDYFLRPAMCTALCFQVQCVHSSMVELVRCFNIDGLCLVALVPAALSFRFWLVGSIRSMNGRKSVFGTTFSLLTFRLI